MRCAECKGKGLCGLERCPVMSRFYARLQVRPGDRYQGSAPSVFVGSYGYPNVAAGPLMIDDSDNPPDWVARGLQIDDVVGLRARTIRGAGESKSVAGSIQDIALSSRPLDVEAQFVKPVTFDLRFDGTIAPIGLTGAIRHLDVLDNPRVERPVDRVTSDTDLSATEACGLLHSSGTDVYRITQLLTAGLLGSDKKRHIVPTRWAITAVDDTVSKRLKKKIAIEVWGRQSLWGQGDETIARDGEGLTKSGYSPLAGAYYSARLAVVEYLDGVQRSARVLVLRHVTGEYWAPLGTWVVREAARNAMRGPGTPCASLDQAVDLASRLVGFSHWQAYSRLIPELRTQKTLFDF